MQDCGGSLLPTRYSSALFFLRMLGLVVVCELSAVGAPNHAFENGRSQASLRSLARAVQRKRYGS